MLSRFMVGFFLVASLSGFATVQASECAASEDNKGFAIVRFGCPEAPYYYHGASYMTLLQHFCENVSHIASDVEGEEWFCVDLETIKAGQHGWFALFLTAPVSSSVNSVIRDLGLAEKIERLGNMHRKPLNLDAVRKKNEAEVQSFFAFLKAKYRGHA